ncbi:MAG: hypothetical protein ACRETQ_09220, partial [Gammaproteobacteria bacterium]
LVFPMRLHFWLVSTAEQVGLAFVAPTPAMVQVADEYIAEERSGVAGLKADLMRAHAVLHN